MNWLDLTTGEKTDLILKGKIEGLSASQIAGPILNCTRSAILGHCSRNGIKLSGNTNQATRKVRPVKPKAPPRPKKKAKVTVLEPTKPYRPLRGRGIPFMERTRKQCVWPINDDTKAMICCGNPTDPDHWQEYCTHHAEEGRGTRTGGGSGFGGWVK